MQLPDIFQTQSRALYEWPQIDLVDEPEINQLRAVVWRTVAASAATSVETSVETPQVPLKTPEAILALLSAQPAMTLAQVASQLGKSTRAIEMAVAKLTESGRLKYVGPKKGGHWEVM
jgi:predicted HTH transcriptional regulator